MKANMGGKKIQRMIKTTKRKQKNNRDGHTARQRERQTNGTTDGQMNECLDNSLNTNKTDQDLLCCVAAGRTALNAWLE